MKIAPSTTDLTASGLVPDMETAKLLRALLRGEVCVTTSDRFPATHAWLRGMYHEPPEQEIRMFSANELCGTHGVECVHADDDGLYGQGSVAFEYLNTGDTYALTIVRRGRWNYRLTSVGDEIERLERRGVRVK